VLSDNERIQIFNDAIKRIYFDIVNDIDGFILF